MKPAKRRFGRPKGFKVSEETRRRMSESAKRKFAKREAEAIAGPRHSDISPAAYAAAAIAPDMNRIERAASTKLARLRSLDAQATSLLQNFIALRRQITQLAQEEEA